MNGVIGMASLLRDTRLNADQREMATSILDSASALLTLLNDILDLSKIESGKLSFEYIPFDLHEVVEGAVELLGAKAAEQRIAICAVVGPGVPQTLWGDPARLRQLLLNLAGNAVKFTQAGGVKVAVRVEAGAAGRSLRFAVIDTGIGIDEEARGRLFLPFEQADASTTRRFGGTGLGLAISRRLVELMGGEIGVESVPGKGSTFWFRLPLADEPVEVEGAAGSPAPLSVVVADENEVRLEATAEVIEGWQGIRVERLRSLEALAARLRDSGRERVDVVVTSFSPEGLESVGAAAGPPLRWVILMPFGTFASEAAARIRPPSVALSLPVRKAQLFAAVVEGRTHSMLEQIDGAVDGGDDSAAGASDMPLNFLLVDDSPVNRKIAQRLLERRQHRVAIACNGQQAVEQVKTAWERGEPFDAILMDCLMPVMDGFEATRAIRQAEAEGRERARPAWIVALTANAMKGDKERCFEAGMDDYLSKPFLPEHLDRVVAMVPRRWQPELPQLTGAE